MGNRAAKSLSLTQFRLNLLRFSRSFAQGSSFCMIVDVWAPIPWLILKCLALHLAVRAFRAFAEGAEMSSMAQKAKTGMMLAWR